MVGNKVPILLKAGVPINPALRFRAEKTFTFYNSSQLRFRGYIHLPTVEQGSGDKSISNSFQLTSAFTDENISAHTESSRGGPTLAPPFLRQHLYRFRDGRLPCLLSYEFCAPAELPLCISRASYNQNCSPYTFDMISPCPISSTTSVRLRAPAPRRGLRLRVTGVRFKIVVWLVRDSLRNIPYDCELGIKITFILERVVWNKENASREHCFRLDRVCDSFGALKAKTTKTMLILSRVWIVQYHLKWMWCCISWIVKM